MRRVHSHKTKLNLVTIAFVVVIVAFGYLTYSLYTQNQEQVQTIGQQSQDIASLETELENKSSVIIGQTSEISELNDLLLDLSIEAGDLKGRLGIAVEEIFDLRPEVRNYFVVGVRGDGKGVVIPVEIKITKGTGALSTNINNVEFRSGTQASIRVAADVASIYTQIPRSDKDIVISFVNTGEELVTVDGGSAGAAITTAIIAALSNKEINTAVLITGTIDQFGTVGPVGAISAKGEAARNANAQVFLVPRGQETSVSGIVIIGVRTIDEAVERIVV